MNVANACKAEELRVRLCFFVNVLNARGLKVGGGSNIGRIVGIVGLNTGGGTGRWAVEGSGWRGVPNAGDDENATFSGGFRKLAMLLYRNGCNFSLHSLSL